MVMEINQWWAYLHVNGSVQTKVYFGETDLQCAHESPFVEKVYGPYSAASREEAVEIAKKNLLASPVLSY